MNYNSILENTREMLNLDKIKLQTIIDSDKVKIKAILKEEKKEEKNNNNINKLNYNFANKGKYSSQNSQIKYHNNKVLDQLQ